VHDDRPSDLCHADLGAQVRGRWLEIRDIFVWNGRDLPRRGVRSDLVHDRPRPLYDQRLPEVRLGVVDAVDLSRVAGVFDRRGLGHDRALLAGSVHAVGDAL
jgi:hypothetical protein